MTRFQEFRNSTLARRLAAAAIFVAVAAAEFALVNIPQPLQLERENVTASKDRSQLVIRLPQGGDTQLFSFDGRKDVVVDVDFDRAAIDPATSLLMRAAGYAPPAGQHWAAYRTEAGSSSSRRAGVCQSFVDVRRADTRDPAELRLFQNGLAGEDRFRKLCVRVTGTATIVRMKTEFDPGGRIEDPGCNKQLILDDWALGVSNVPVAMIVPQGRGFCLTLQAATGAAAFVSAPEALFSRIRLSEAIAATEIQVVRTQPQGKTAPLVQIQPDGETILTARSLAVGSDIVQVTVEADRAWVWRDGKRSTYSVLEKMQKYPVISVFIGGLNAAILAAIRRLFLRTPAKPPTAPLVFQS
jgi:hypothetical protein